MSEGKFQGTLAESRLAAGGYAGGPPGAPPPGWVPPPGAPGAPPPGGPPGPPPPKPITGGKETLAMHARSLDPRTGLPLGEKPPASTAAVVAMVAGCLPCLGPLTGLVAIVAGFMGRSAARKAPAHVGGAGLSLIAILLGVMSVLGWAIAFVVFVLYAALDGALPH